MKYRASIRYNGRTKHILHSDDPLTAHEAYWNEKVNIAKELLNNNYVYIDNEIKTIIYNRLKLKHIESYDEIQRAITDGYFNNMEV